MACFRLCATLGLLLASAQAADVTPMAKVIKLLEDLKSDVETEAKEEAATYEKFACFCKDTTGKKGDAIMKDQETIDQCTADIGINEAKKKEKNTKRDKERVKVEETTKKLEETTEQYNKDKATYEATNADLTKAVNSAKRAHEALKNSKAGAAFIDLGTKSDVRNCLDLALALGMVQEAEHKAATSFLQVDPNDPAYKFHSDKILSIIQDLKDDFQKEKDAVQKEWKKTDDTYKAEKKDLEAKIDTAEKEIKKLTGEIDKLVSDIAKLKTELVNAEDALKDDSAYMKDLTERCEANAQAWDQRSQARHGEVTVLREALDILNKKAKDADADVNKRALLMHVKKPAAPVAQAATKASPKAPVKAAAAVKAPVKAAAVKTPAKAVKPASNVKPTAKKALSFLQAGSSRVLKAQERAVAILRQEGSRLNSHVLSALAEKIAADPFGKIKKLIQALIERLLKESKAEATKKGFCDTELGKSKEDRNNRFADVNRLDTDLSELEAHKKKMEMENSDLAEALKDLNKELDKATDLRKDEKEENAKNIKTAKAGAEAVGEALTILKDFYKDSAKNKVLLQVSASPVDEDAPEGVGGAYKGNQSASKGILGLLEVIKSDFERTVRKTEAAEEQAHAEFIKFDRASKADIAGKETKTALNKQDLESTTSAIKQGMKDLQTATDLLDKALQNIEDLKPTCIDTGMSYKERVQKREEEIKALGKALCALDPDKVESECK